MSARRTVGTLLLGAGLGLAAVKLYHARSTGGQPVAVINGDPITTTEFYGALKMLSGDQALDQLTQLKLVLHAARDKHISVSADEVEKSLTPAQKEAEKQDTGVRDVIEMEARVALLTPQLSLLTVDDASKRRFYDMFKDDLTLYDIQALVPRSPEDGAAVEKALKSGKPFAEVAATYPSRLKSPTLSGETRLVLSGLFGDEARDRILRLKPGQTAEALPSSVGPLFVRMDAVHSSYEDLKATIEKVLVDGDHVRLMDDLLAQAKISSRYLQPDFSPTSTPTP